MNVYLLRPDGTYEASFASDYTIDDTLRVFSRKRQRYLTPDVKGRVWLTHGGESQREYVAKIYRDSKAMATQHGQVQFTVGKYKDVYLTSQHRWRIPSGSAFVTYEFEQPYPPYAHYQDDSILLVQRARRDKVAGRPAFRPTFTQFATWLEQHKYSLASLPDEYDLYRNIQQYTVPQDYRLVIKHAGRSVFFTHDGAVMTITKEGLKTHTGHSTLASNSTMLTQNRLVFAQTAGLVSGAFTPLLTYVFRGAPPEQHVMYSITGNKTCLDASNYVWVPHYKVRMYNEVRRWLTRLWYYECVG